MKKRWIVTLVYGHSNTVTRKVYAGTAMKALIDVIQQEGVPTDIRDMHVVYEGEVTVTA